MRFEFIMNPGNELQNTENITVIKQFYNCIELLELSVMRSYEYAGNEIGTWYDILYISLLVTRVLVVLVCKYL